MLRLDASVRPALRTIAGAVLLFAGTVALYTRVLAYGFTNYDDPRYLTNNPHVQGGFTAESLRWAFVGNADYWHPLTWLSHIADWQMYGDNAAGHHLTSVLWHAANAVLAFLVFRRLTRAFWLSFLSAALFAWHPLRVESVAWITERKDVMSGAFLLLTVWAYAGYANRRREARPATAMYVVTLALFAAGLMCKPTLVTLPLVLLALDAWPLGRADRAMNANRNAWPALWREKIPFFLLSGATAVATVRMQHEAGAFTLSLPLGARLANVPVALARYLEKFFWPVDLSVCYRHPGWWPATLVGASLTLVILITFLSWQARQRRPWLLTGWGWFLAMLLPTLGIVQVGFQAMADRYTYASILGWQLAVIWTGRELARRGVARVGMVIAASAALLACAVRTWQQQATWRDSATLFTQAIAVDPQNDVAEAFLGYTLLSERELDAAATHGRRALALNSRNDLAVYTLAQIDAQRGRLDEAIVGYRRALELKPDDASTEYELGLLLLRAGRADEAGGQLRTAAQHRPSIVAANLRLAEEHVRAHRVREAALYFAAGALLTPANPDAHFLAGQAFARIDQPAPAMASLQRAIALAPGHAAAHTELGFLLLTRRDPAAAASHFTEALRVQPDLASAAVGLGRAEEQLGHRASATEAFRRALAAAPDDPTVPRAWAETLARRGEFAAAIPYYERAVQLAPQDAANHAGLGFVLFLAERRTEAIAAWQEALRLDPHFPGLRERLEKIRR